MNPILKKAALAAVAYLYGRSKAKTHVISNITVDPTKHKDIMDKVESFGRAVKNWSERALKAESNIETLQQLNIDMHHTLESVKHERDNQKETIKEQVCALKSQTAELRALKIYNGDIKPHGEEVIWFGDLASKSRYDALNASYKRLSGSYDTQADTIEKLTKALDVVQHDRDLYGHQYGLQKAGLRKLCERWHDNFVCRACLLDDECSADSREECIEKLTKLALTP